MPKEKKTICLDQEVIQKVMTKSEKESRSFGYTVNKILAGYFKIGTDKK